MSESGTPTLVDLLTEVVAADPGAVVVIDTHGSPRRTTRGEFWRRTVALRDDLRARGVGRGDCLGVWLPNWSGSLVWQFAAAALGAHVIGINTRYGVADVAHVLAKAQPKVVAVAHEFLGLDLAGRLRAAVTEADCLPPSVAVISAPGAAPAADEALPAYDVGAGAWVPSPPSAELDLGALSGAPDEMAVAFTTSGSTGRPKLAAHRSSAVARHARAVAEAGGWDETSVSLIVLPLSGVFGFVPALAAIAGGGAVLLEPSFDPALVLRHMEEFAVSHLAGADDISGRLMAAWRARPADLKAWRRLLIGDFYGNSMQVSAWAESETGTPVFGIYGSSEVFALTAFWREHDPAPARWRGGGRPVSAGIEVRAVDPFSGEPATGDEPGELQFRGYHVVDTYLGDADGAIRRGSFTDDGWFRSGDLGTVRPDGSFHYLCRMGDSLRLKGFLVEPAEIENRLAEHPSVARTKVVGLTVDGETSAIAFVEPVPGSAPDPAELRAWCASTLAKFKVPRTVHLISEMPTTVGTNGAKIRAAALRELAEQLATPRQEVD
ncbi:AMP-binding protein [Amycolatopsis acidiphila]|uniref:Long-chain-fatty-acid--CoA ligase n=1 Tax=Amycolatopsis acidiphila TaxID=715473 RepID=A0A558AIZ2_9PSEU|nr:AMP-binding protein [Amycolatopsis acidiphila]TVT24234.1 AMP-binding protein [Amycolatopsis acidiphila]UIJ62635.1 AMP-binding protein [Amycolatopsis acidiphila]GHG85881.1 acyl-CoA synthetase [Amycolatopsis acidiphila]